MKRMMTELTMIPSRIVETFYFTILATIVGKEVWSTAVTCGDMQELFINGSTKQHKIKSYTWKLSSLFFSKMARLV